MLVVTIRTDSPTAEVGLFEGHTQIAYETWEAGRSLSVHLHRTIQTVLARQGKTLHDIQAVVCFAGPGSFTGLRIGLTVGNALAYGLQVPVVATQDPDWLHTAIRRLQNNGSDPVALPFYGAPVHITTPRR